jgi:aminodeoxychorismate synthase component I
MTSRHTTLLDRPEPFRPHGDLAGPGGLGFHLDSSLIDGRLGRYSYVGGDPSALLTARRRPGEMTFDLELSTRRDPGGQPHDPPLVRCWTGDPFDALRNLHRSYHPGSPEGRFPFNGGLVGYFGYETGYAVESLPDTGEDDLGLPDLAFMVFDDIFIRDHGNDDIWVTHVLRGDEDAGARKQIHRDRVETLASRAQPRFEDPPPLPAADRADLPPDVRGHFDADSYAAVVERCRQHILAGDVFEVCPTQRLEMDLQADPWVLFAALRRVTPSPFGAFLRLPGFAVASASPERFLRLDRDGTVESRPIKGTRPRGDSTAHDDRLRAELAGSEKDRAENVMIVDLVRNDLGRVCETGSVHVPELQVVEDYATVFQMVSTVRGRLRSECDAFDLVRACFPGGSMTGAPKVAAMEIIDDVEPVKRGVYSGAIGYIDWSGAMDLNIVIRTLVCQDGRATFGVGGAVVSDSDPAAEYRETLDKARALIAAVRMANDSAG